MPVSNASEWNPGDIVRLLFCPWQLSGRIDQWPLLKVWLLHLVTMILGFIGFLTSIDIWTQEGITEAAISGILGNAAGIMGLLLTLAIVQGAIALTAVIFSAWGAGDESSRVSSTRALKRLWAFSPCLLAVLLVVTHFAMLIIKAGYNWYEANPDWTWSFRYPPPVESRPFVVRFSEEIIFSAILIALIYVTGVYICLLGAGRSTPRSRWPGHCENCNYSLVGCDHDGYCPECGTPVSQSLSPTTRQGIWQADSSSRLLNHKRLFSSLFALFNSQKIGKQVLLYDSQSRAGWHFLKTALLVIFSMPILFFLIIFISDPKDFLTDISFDLIVENIVLSYYFAFWCMFIVLLAVSGLSGLSGFIAGRSSRRNLKPAAIQIAARMSGSIFYLTLLCAAVLAVMVKIETSVDDISFKLAKALNIDTELIAMTILFGPFVLYIILFTTQLARATRCARHANG